MSCLMVMIYERSKHMKDAMFQFLKFPIVIVRLICSEQKMYQIMLGIGNSIKCGESGLCQKMLR